MQTQAQDRGSVNLQVHALLPIFRLPAHEAVDFSKTCRLKAQQPMMLAVPMNFVSVMMPSLLACTMLHPYSASRGSLMPLHLCTGAEGESLRPTNFLVPTTSYYLLPPSSPLASSFVLLFVACCLAVLTCLSIFVACLLWPFIVFGFLLLLPVSCWHPALCCLLFLVFAGAFVFAFPFCLSLSLAACSFP